MKPYERGERGRGDRGRDLAADQESALIHDVHECAGRNRKQKHRQAVGNLHHRDGERVGVKVCHEPARGHVVHPATDVRDYRRGPDHRERPTAKWSPMLTRKGRVLFDS